MQDAGGSGEEITERAPRQASPGHGRGDTRGNAGEEALSVRVRRRFSSREIQGRCEGPWIGRALRWKGMRLSTPGLILAGLILLRTLPASASDGTSLEVLCSYYGESLDASSEENRMLLDTLDDMTVGEDGPGLEETRLRLELKRLETERSLLDLLCGGERLTVQKRQRAEALIRKARQARCHAEGKLLARAEVDPSSSESRQRQDFYRQRVERCIESGIAAAEVRFASADGGVVYGNLRGAGDHGVVLAHGGRFTKESWAGQAAVLADAGFLVLAFDFRGRGRSRGPEGAPPDGEYHDVLGAVRYLRGSQGVETVTVIGASFGGWAAARAVVEVEPGEIDRLVLLAHSPIEMPESLAGCKLFIVAEDDVRGGGIRRLEEIRAQYERSPAPKLLEVLPGSAHAQHLFQTDQAERLMGEILGFLKAPCAEALDTPETSPVRRN